jgi:PAS domain-containing protein
LPGAAARAVSAKLQRFRHIFKSRIFQPRGGHGMYKAAMIFPGEIGEELKAQLKANDIAFYNADMQQAVIIAKECEKGGVDVIISRAGLEAAIKKAVGVPVVNCELTHSDIVRSIFAIKKDFSFALKELGLFNYASVTYDIRYLEKVTNVKIRQFWYWDDPDDLRQRLLECKYVGVDAALGANMTVKFAKECGIKGYMKQIGQETLGQSIQKAHEIIEIRRKDLEYAGKIKNMLSFAREGILFVDEGGKIEYANPRAAEIIGRESARLEGTDLHSLLPGPEGKKEGMSLEEHPQCRPQGRSKILRKSNNPIERMKKHEKSLIKSIFFGLFVV